MQVNQCKQRSDQSQTSSSFPWAWQSSAPACLNYFIYINKILKDSFDIWLWLVNQAIICLVVSTFLLEWLLEAKSYVIGAPNRLQLDQFWNPKASISEFAVQRFKQWEVPPVPLSCYYQIGSKFGKRSQTYIFSCDEQLKKWRCHSVCLLVC